MARYPALEIHAIDPDLILAVVDDHSPTAVEEHEDGLRVFFAKASDRDHAGTAMLAAYPAAQVVTVEVDDEEWARRSQASLRPVTVGRLTVLPASPTSDQSPALTAQDLPPDGPPPIRGAGRPGPTVQQPTPGANRVTASAQRQTSSDGTMAIVIQPSMGFGTGHHATTRLCLAALQALDLAGRTVLDVGTGSGILAIAAVRLGAAAAVGLDHDADAIAAARENLILNPVVRQVVFRTADLRETTLPTADIVVANLTGALLVAAASRLEAAVKAGGTLVVSGLLEDEEDAVRQALAPAAVTWRGAEDGWVALAANLREPAAV